MKQPIDEPTLVRISVPVAAWLLETNRAAWPSTIGLCIAGSTMIWLPWWARLIALTGYALTLLGVELENLAHRIDGANTMMFLMKDDYERKR